MLRGILDMYGIIYKAQCIENGKCYYGQTIYDLKDRIKGHKYVIKNPKDKFHYALRKHGFANFEWSIVDHAKNREELDIAEKFWISSQGTINFGYNTRVGGSSGKLTNRVSMSEETKRKISKALTGRTRTQEHRDNIGASQKGKKHSYEHNLHIAMSTTKLTAKQVREILIALNKGELQKDLAERYQVSPPLISYIKSGKHWSLRKNKILKEKRINV